MRDRSETGPPRRRKAKGLVHSFRNGGETRINRGHENRDRDWQDFPILAGGHRNRPAGAHRADGQAGLMSLDTSCPGHSIPDMTAATRLLKKLRRHERDPCLYIYPFSIPCLAVHFTIVLALRGKLRPSRDLSHLGYRLVNIEKHENLREWYLVEVNALGRVRCFILKLRNWR